MRVYKNCIICNKNIRLESIELQCPDCHNDLYNTDMFLAIICNYLEDVDSPILNHNPEPCPNLIRYLHKIGNIKHE